MEVHHLMQVDTMAGHQIKMVGVWDKARDK